MNGMRDMMEVILWLYAIGIVLLILFVAALISLYKIFSKKSGRKERALEQLKKAVHRIVFIIIVAIGANYYHDADLRTRAYDCETEKSARDGGIYTAQLCYIPNFRKTIMLLRIYSTNNGTLLAERMYEEPDVPRLSWDRDWVLYTTDDGGSIDFPPTLKDRLLAKLP